MTTIQVKKKSYRQGGNKKWIEERGHDAADLCRDSPGKVRYHSKAVRTGHDEKDGRGTPSGVDLANTKKHHVERQAKG